jgi:predicted hotdog family 3-hydroxylacyl-ACP dehydratase
VKPDYNILNVVPHGMPMSLLDDIEDYSDNGLVAKVTISEDSMFCESDGVPAWVGVEYMGQAIGAYAGVKARIANRPVKIGFLVSTRRYESPCSHFPVGTSLTISVDQITDSTIGLQVFACRITGKNIEIQANLNVLMPENLDDF